MANFQHLKATRTRVLNTLPVKSFGNDGDIVISRVTGRGVFICIKAGGMWYVANQLQELARIGKSTLKDLTTDKLNVKSILNADSNVSDVVVSDSGNIKFKTSKQLVDDLPLPFNNISYKQAYCSLERYTDQETCEANGGTWYYSTNDTHDSISSTAENQLLTIGQMHNSVDAEPTLLYDGSVLEIKRNTDFDDNWQTTTNDNVLKLSYSSSVSSTLGTDSSGVLKVTASSTDLSGTLEISTIAEIGSDTDKFLMSDSGVVKFVTGANLRSYIGAGTGDGDITSVVAGDGLTGGATSGDATLNVNVDDSTIETNSDALRIKDDGVTYAKLQNVTNARMLGNNAGSDGVVTEMTKANVLSFLNVADGAEANVSGDSGNAAIYDNSGTPAFKSGITKAEVLSLLNVADGAGVAPTNFVTNDADDTMAGTLTIDKNNTATTTANVRGLLVDFDHTGISASGQTINNISIDVALRSDGVTHVGEVNNYGVRNTLIGATSGTQTNYGIYNALLNADDNIGIYNLITDGGTDLKFVSSADTGDFFSIATTTHGATTIATVDDDAGAADLILDIDGDITLDAFGKQIYFSRSGTNFFLFDMNSEFFRMISSLNSNDYFQIAIGSEGATTISTVDADTAAAHLNIEVDGHVEFDGCGVGFDLVTPTYNAADTTVDFRAGNKQFLTFGAGNIADLNLLFPATSGNFTLLLKQDGTGSRTIAADGYLVFEYDGTAASGSSTVKFPGGSNPTLTTDANHVDIISFFWDADNQICYGVASLDFQF